MSEGGPTIERCSGQWRQSIIFSPTAGLAAREKQRPKENKFLTQCARHTIVIPAPRRWRQGNWEFRISLDYIVRPCSKKRILYVAWEPSEKKTQRPRHFYTFHIEVQYKIMMDFTRNNCQAKWYTPVTPATERGSKSIMTSKSSSILRYIVGGQPGIPEI